MSALNVSTDTRSKPGGLSWANICVCQEKEEEAALSALNGAASTLQEPEQEDST